MKKMINKPIYPEIQIDSIENSRDLVPVYKTIIRTFLRKQHNDKWYLILHINEASSYKNIEESKFLALNDLSHNIYTSINFAKIDPNLKHPIYGNLMYPLDDFQGTELERFNLMYEIWNK